MSRTLKCRKIDRRSADPAINGAKATHYDEGLLIRLSSFCERSLEEAHRRKLEAVQLLLHHGDPPNRAARPELAPIGAALGQTGAPGWTRNLM
jgi:hypothetical protein